jgi:hypothetical protein
MGKYGTGHYGMGILYGAKEVVSSEKVNKHSNELVYIYIYRKKIPFYKFSLSSSCEESSSSY